MAHTNSVKACVQILTLVGLSLTGMSLGGCQYDHSGYRDRLFGQSDEYRHDVYRARRDSITMGAGNAVATNRAIHTIDPWPWYVQDKKINTNGERMYKAVDCYEKNQSIEPEGLATNDIIAVPANGGGQSGKECGTRNSQYGNGGNHTSNSKNGN